MARFRLRDKHYLNVPGTEWEQTETTNTGKQGRHRYKVHMYLDPDDPSLCNYPGEIIVSTKEDPAFPKDIVFVGKPSFDMEPIDDEAHTILAKMTQPIHPMSEAALPTIGPAPSEARPDPLAEMRQMMAEMRGQITDLVGQNEALRQRLATKETAELNPPPAPTPAINLRM